MSGPLPPCEDGRRSQRPGTATRGSLAGASSGPSPQQHRRRRCQCAAASIRLDASERQGPGDVERPAERCGSGDDPDEQKPAAPHQHEHERRRAPAAGSARRRRAAPGGGSRAAAARISVGRAVTASRNVPTPNVARLVIGRRTSPASATANAAGAVRCPRIACRTARPPINSAVNQTASTTTVASIASTQDPDRRVAPRGRRAGSAGGSRRQRDARWPRRPRAPTGSSATSRIPTSQRHHRTGVAGTRVRASCCTTASPASLDDAAAGGH